MADDLYEQDFYLWTRAQAEALRSHAGGSNVLDYDRLAEEVQDLGSAQRNKAESYLRQIIAHLYKLSSTRNVEPVNHWRAEIVEFRVHLRGVLTGAIRKTLARRLAKIHQDALVIADAKMMIYEPDVEIDTSLNWTLPELLGDRNDPVPPRREWTAR